MKTIKKDLCLRLARAALEALDENMVEPILDHVRPTQRAAVRDGLLQAMSERIAIIFEAEQDEPSEEQ